MDAQGDDYVKIVTTHLALQEQDFKPTNIPRAFGYPECLLEKIRQRTARLNADVRSKIPKLSLKIY